MGAEDVRERPAGVPRRRRFDPDRRSGIVQAAVEVVVEHGVRGLTQRLVAAAADVPLGSVTYHFATREDLVLAAFARFVEEQNALFERRVGAARTREELLEVLVELVVASPTRERPGVLAFELRLGALRDERLRELTAGWTDASRRTLARVMDTAAAADLDAYLEGLILHGLTAREPAPLSEIRASVARLVDTVPVRFPVRDA